VQAAPSGPVIGLLGRLPALLQERLASIRGQGARPSFSWNVWVMLAGTFAGQGISILLSPVLTRIYDPGAFGYLGVYSVLLYTTCVIACLGLDLAIPITASDFECANLLALSAIALVVTTSVIAAITYVLPAHILSPLWLGSIASYRPLLPIGFFLLGAYYLMLALATRAHAFQDIASTRIAQGLAGPVSQIALGLLGGGAPGLAVGFVIGQSSGTIQLFSRTVLRDTTMRAMVSWRGIVAMARRYMHFPLFASWSKVIELAGSTGVLFVLFAGLFSGEVAGFMALSDRVILRPLWMVSTSVLQVFTGEAGRSISRDPVQLRRRFRQVVSRQFLLASGWIVLTNLLAAWVFPLAFGEVWGNAVPYLHALSLTYLGLAVLHPVSNMLQMLERQVMAVAWQTARLVLVSAAVLLPWQAGCSAVGTLWIFSVVQGACCATMLALTAWTIDRQVAAAASPYPISGSRADRHPASPAAE